MSPFTFVSCINRPEVARSCLLASPCLAVGSRHQLILAQGMGSAGEGYRWALELADNPWIVLVHQDVYLPQGWDQAFAAGLQRAGQLHPSLAVAGVYGVRADGLHVGHVLDRDRWLGTSPVAIEPVRSLDELLLAVRRDSGLVVSPELGWHLYGTDLCLQAEADAVQAVVLDAPCEHRSTLQRTLVAGDELAAADTLQLQLDAFNAAAHRLAARWPQALPVVTAVTTVDHGSTLTLAAR